MRTILVYVFVLVLAATGTVLGASGPGEVVLRREDNGQGTYAPATFPHWVHIIRYRCYACHPALFKMTEMELTKGSLKEDRPPFWNTAEALAADEAGEAEETAADAPKTPEDLQRAMHGPEGCGLCHKGDGPAFNVEFKACARCHVP